MILKKEESKRKIMSGAMSLVTVVGLTALTVVTGGASLPLLAAAGVKATYAVADIAEGVDGYSKMNALDASRPANFLRDTVFFGSDTLYNLGSMASDIVFYMVTGNALMNVGGKSKFLVKLGDMQGKAGKLWDGICKKTKVVNFFTQLGGTMIFGSVNDYIATGKVDWKNLGIDALTGVIKGTFGTDFAEWGKTLFDTDSKVARKLIGTIFGTVFGTVVDLGGDLLAGREIDVLETFNENLLESGLGQAFGDPIDVGTGAFLITATDFMVSDIRQAVKVQRKYNSTNAREGVLGRGWKFTYEGRLYNG